MLRAVTQVDDNHQRQTMATANSSIKIIKNEEISALLTWEEIVPAIEEALRRYSLRDNGDVIQPIRTSFITPHNRYRIDFTAEIEVRRMSEIAQ